MFVVYLSTLKHQLSLYSDEYKWTHLFIKLKSELRMIITNVQSISMTWNALINLVAQLKINLQKEYFLLLKQSQDRDLYDQTKINKKTYFRQKKSYKLIKLNTLSKLSFNTLMCYNKDLLKIMCWICNRKNHYAINCKDEKIKNKSKEFDVNQVFIDSMLHMNHLKISRKNKLLMNTSNHWGKNKKFSL